MAVPYRQLWNSGLAPAQGMEDKGKNWNGGGGRGGEAWEDEGLPWGRGGQHPYLPQASVSSPVEQR